MPSNSTDTPQLPPKKSRKGIKLKRHGLSGNPLWNRWRRMIDRCHSERLAKPGYADRGIKVCQRWRESFEAFIADMGEPPTPQHQIERKDNNGDYEPSNCRWATPKANSRNRRCASLYTIRGFTATLAEWMSIAVVTRNAVETRLEKGWSITDALLVPKFRQNWRGCMEPALDRSLLKFRKGVSSPDSTASVQNRTAPSGKEAYSNTRIPMRLPYPAS